MNPPQTDSTNSDTPKEEPTPVAVDGTDSEQKPAETPTQWAYKAEDQPQAPTTEAAAVAPNTAAEVPPTVYHDPVSWTASEYIAHHKSPLWYMGLAAATVALGVVVYLVTQDYIALGVVAVMAILFGVSAARPPQTLAYVIDDEGIGIGPKHYTFTMFRSFSVVDDGPFSSITLLSTKRYMPPLSVYYPHELEEKIVQKLSDVLPFEHKQADLVEHLMRRIRF